MIKEPLKNIIRSRPRLGAHVSASGGYHLAVQRAVEMGAECMQIFGASPRQWDARRPSEEEIKEYKNALSQSGIAQVFLHAAYLPNLAAEDLQLRKKSIRSLTDHLRIAEMLGAYGLIFHMGSAKNKDDGAKRIADGMHAVLKNVPGEAKLVMENSAGSAASRHGAVPLRLDIGGGSPTAGSGGTKLGATVEEMGKIYRLAKAASRIRICIDTAHSFESGALDEFSVPKIKKFFDLWDEHVGIQNIAALHINDSLTPANSHHDRHQNLGEGYIGLAGFKNLAKEKRLNHTAWMLEVPGFAGEGPDKENLDILKGCFSL